jgi:hypothetical protein
MKFILPSTTLYTSFLLAEAKKAGLIVSPNAEADVEKYLKHISAKRLNTPASVRNAELISMSTFGAKNYDEFKKAIGSHPEYLVASFRDGLQAIPQIVQAGKRIRVVLCGLPHFSSEVFMVSLVDEKPQLSTMAMKDLRMHDAWLVQCK